MKRWAAAAIWIISIAIAIGFGVSHTGGRIAIGILDLRPADYVALTLVCLLGFATCPYLDLTFHRARQFSSAPRCSFGFGFGIVFLTMILFTYVYAHSVWMALPPLLIAGMATHLILQSGFTVAAHANELRTSRLAWVLVVGLVGLSVPLVIVAPTARAASELPLWELGYRTFMGFYGLIFPAYVWLVMMPRAPLDKKWLIFFAAVLAAFPAYGVGFLLRDYKWLLIGVAMVVLPRVFLLSRRRKYADA